MIVNLSDAIPQERIRRDFEILQIRPIAQRMDEGVSLGRDDFTAIEAGSRGGGFARIRDGLEAGGRHLGLGPGSRARTLDQLFVETVVRLDAGLEMVIIAPLVEGFEKRIQRELAEIFPQIVTDARGERANVIP